MSKNIEFGFEDITMDGIDGKYQINHKNTNNEELAVTITQTLSKILDKPPTEIHLDNYFNLDGLNQIYKDIDKESQLNSKITFHIENHKIEINNKNQITITQK